MKGKVRRFIDQGEKEVRLLDRPSEGFYSTQLGPPKLGWPFGVVPKSCPKEKETEPLSCCVDQSLKVDCMWKEI